MSSLEQSAKRQRRRNHVEIAVLGTLTVSGTLLVAVLAPNVLQALGGFRGNKHKFKYRLKSVSSRLADKGYVRFVTQNGKKKLEITDAGRAELARQTEQPRRRLPRWDKRWRLVMFDIPERRRAQRDALRYMMEAYGFIRLQDSAWVYPYDCEALVALLKADLHLGKAVLYLIVEKIENDADLKRHFGLK